MEQTEHTFWVYGALVLVFACIGYLFKRVSDVEKNSSDFKTQLPLINQKLDELNLTLKMFLKQEIDELKDLTRRHDKGN